MSITRFIHIATLAVFVVSCDVENDSDPGVAISYEVLATSTSLRVDDPHTNVFRDWSEWTTFWAEHPECSSGCVFSPPYIDFDSSTVAGIFWGLEGWTGLDLSRRVESVTRKGVHTTIHLREQPPAEALPAEGYSYLFLKFDRADGPVTFTGVVPQ